MSKPTGQPGGWTSGVKPSAAAATILSLPVDNGAQVGQWTVPAETYAGPTLDVDGSFVVAQYGENLLAVLDADLTLRWSVGDG